MTTPRLSVVMSVYNGGELLRPAIESILGQTFRDFEFIIVNDGSTDGSLAVIESYDDPRIRLIDQTNHGLVASLNTAIEVARAGLIARMDADDISAPERFQRQFDFMDLHPDHVIVGCNLIFIDEAGKEVLDSPLLLHDADIKLEMLIRSPFAHGSVMYRTEAVKAVGGYHQELWPAEDYDLWQRLVLRGAFANLDQALYFYRVNDGGISVQNEAKQRACSDRVRNALWAKSNSLISPLSFGAACRTYPQVASYTKIQRGRLFEVYRLVATESLCRGQFRLMFTVIASILSSWIGWLYLSKYIMRKTLRR